MADGEDDGSNVVPFAGKTTQEIPVETVLGSAKGCEVVLVLGRNPDGTFYAASSSADRPTLLDMIEQFKFDVFSGAYAD